MKTLNHSLAARISAIGISLILLLMPFHAFLVVVASEFVGYKLVWQSWKELLIATLLILTSYLIVRYRLLNNLLARRENVVVLAIVVFGLVVSLLHWPLHQEFLTGLKTDLVALALFVCAQIVSSYFSDKKLAKLILIPATVVAIVALLQPWLFRPELLLRLGYGPEGQTSTIIAGQYIESAASTLRAFSTLGGPNQLGAYLIVPFAVSLAYVLHAKKYLFAILSILFGAGIVVSYSRSAWLGAVFCVLVSLAFLLPAKKRLYGLGVIGVLAIATVAVLLWPNQCQLGSILPKAAIHGECENENLAGSDQQRLESQKTALKVIAHNPLGLGLGSAGPASFYSSAPLITENWYLQIAIEFGLVGLVLWLLYFVLILRRLYLQANEKAATSIWPTAMFAALIGVGVACFFLHSLADSTLMLILFALFGIIFARTDRSKA